MFKLPNYHGKIVMRSGKKCQLDHPVTMPSAQQYWTISRVAHHWSCDAPSIWHGTLGIPQKIDTKCNVAEIIILN